MKRLIVLASLLTPCAALAQPGPGPVPGGSTNASTLTSGTLPAARLPVPTASTLGGVESLAVVGSKWINTISTAGVPAATQPACGDLSNAGTACQAATGTSGATVPLLNAANTWGAPQSNAPTTLTIATATFTPNATSNIYYATLVHASCPCTVANPSTMPAASALVEIWITQSATGSDTVGTWGSYYKFPGGTKPTLSTGASAVDMVSCRSIDSTHLNCVSAANFQ